MAQVVERLVTEQTSSTLISSGSWIKINVGAISLVEVKNIARELQYVWRGLDKVKPKAELRVTQDSSGQYFVHLNGRAMLYVLLFCSKIAELAPEPIKQAAEMPEMPPGFLQY